MVCTRTEPGPTGVSHGDRTTTAIELVVGSLWLHTVAFMPRREAMSSTSSWYTVATCEGREVDGDERQGVEHADGGGALAQEDEEAVAEADDPVAP